MKKKYEAPVCDELVLYTESIMDGSPESNDEEVDMGDLLIGLDFGM